MYYDQHVNISDLIGKTMKSVKKIGGDEIQFETVDGDQYKMYHQQDCCEDVGIDDINGDLEDLVGTPILQAEERTSREKQSWEAVEEDNGWGSDSFTWTFYHLATIKGYVTIRWYGASNGYYSESVDIAKI